MSADPILVLAWLVLAHLVGDFVFQNYRVVAAKTADGWRGVRGIVMHSGLVGLCLVPFGLAFGDPGWVVVVVLTLSHGLIDRLKIIMTRRAEAAALADARRRHESGDGLLGSAWTPLPGTFYLLDQLAHLGLAIWAWAIWLAGAPPTPEFAAAIDRSLGGWSPDDVHRVALVVAVGASLLIANIRGGQFFVATLVHSREVRTAAAAGSGAATAGGSGTAAPRPVGWSVRVGPFAARVEPDAEPGGAESEPPAARHDGSASPARIGATIGILERLLIVVFILTEAEVAIGFVLAAKTLARFRQLDDRDFAEYYLLGTLASVAVAIGTGLLARAALSTLGG